MCEHKIKIKIYNDRKRIKKAGSINAYMKRIEHSCIGIGEYLRELGIIEEGSWVISCPIGSQPYGYREFLDQIRFVIGRNGIYLGVDAGQAPLACAMLFARPDLEDLPNTIIAHAWLQELPELLRRSTFRAISFNQLNQMIRYHIPRRRTHRVIVAHDSKRMWGLVSDCNMINEVFRKSLADLFYSQTLHSLYEFGEIGEHDISSPRALKLEREIYEAMSRIAKAVALELHDIEKHTERLGLVGPFGRLLRKLHFNQAYERLKRKTIVKHICEVLRDVGFSEVFVVCWNEPSKKFIEKLSVTGLTPCYLIARK